MGARREAKIAAAAATAAENMSSKAYVDAALREYKPRKGGTAKFKKGSKVLVPHTDQYYAALVMQGQKRDDGQYYLLHYEGWSNKYNEWVKEGEVKRYDRTLLEQSAAAAGNAPGDLTGRKRTGDVAPAEPQLAVEIPHQLRLHIPPLLKKIVLDDSEQVNLKGQLLPLPRKAHGRPTVNDILKDYEDALAKEAAREAAREDAEPPNSQVVEAAREMVAGLRRYFDQGLRHFLLYSHEMQQADAALGLSSGSGGAATPPNTEGGGKAGGSTAGRPAGGGGGAQPPRRSPCDVYGAEHLVRLFVKLPELVPVAYMTAPDVVRLEQQLHDLMARMTEVKKQARYFSLPQEYQTNPHFNALMPLHYQNLLSATGGAGGTAGAAGGTPAPAAGGTPAARAGGRTPAAAAAAAASKGGTPAPDTGASSEAADMEQDG